MKIDVETNQYIEIPETKIPYLHHGGPILGVRVGLLYWILGGTMLCQLHGFLDVDKITGRSSVWGKALLMLSKKKKYNARENMTEII